eukprot:NODE_11533_length_1280_cov_9.380746.p7 GENE.NODE_11533_length_1280_cov_9.380746~~NODE_11533_length_1280_cov_9.380746.p7  ORF type:complete len:66 (-),score=12.40 NODE_11533_length_1280_cov_9.380746:335-532(-)
MRKAGGIDVVTKVKLKSPPVPSSSSSVVFVAVCEITTSWTLATSHADPRHAPARVCAHSRATTAS